MASAAFYSPTYKAPTLKLPSFQSGANSIQTLSTNPYAQQQSYASIPGLQQYAASNPFTSQPFKVPGSTTVNQGGYPYTTVPIKPGGPSSNTAGGGATITDVNSGNPNHTIGDSAYDPTRQTTIDQNYIHQLMANDPTLAAELDSLALQNQQSWSNFLTSAQQAEIAYGGGYNPTSDANLGFNAAGFGAKALTNILPTSDYTHGLAMPQGSLMDALSDPRILAAIDPSNPSSGYGVSALGQIAYQLKQANNAASANLRARGGYSSGALGQHLNENLYQNSVASNTALNNFLSALQGGYGSYLTDFGGAQTSQQADVNQTLQNIISGIGAGLYVLPSSTPNNPGGDTPGFPNPPAVTSPGWGPANDMDPTDYGGGPYVSIPQTGTVLDQARTLSQAYITPAVTKKYNLSPGIGNWAT